MHKKIGNLSIKCTCVCSQSCLTLCNPMDCSPPDSSVSVEFSRQEYWNGLPSPTPEDFPDPGIRPMSPLLVGDSLPLCLCVYTYIGKAHIHEKYVCKWEKNIHRYFICKSIYLGIDIDVKVLDSRYLFPPLPLPTSTLVKVQSYYAFITQQFSFETCKTELGSWWGWRHAQAFKELTIQRTFVFLEDNVDSSIYRSLLLEHHDLDSQRILWKSFLKSKKIEKWIQGPMPLSW